MICSKCKNNTPLNGFYKNSTRKNGFSSWCKKCHRRYRKDNKYDNKLATKKYYSKHKNEDDFKHTKRASRKKTMHKGVKNLSDHYCKKLIKGQTQISSIKHIPKELIELKRKQIIIERLIKQ